MSATAERRRALRALVEAGPVHSQAELLELLASRGHATTQPALSRDLRALNVVKRDGVYRVVEEERVTPLEYLSNLLRDVRWAGDHMTVIVCEPGAASAIARALEAEAPAGLVGTVAGDDTVFVAVDSKQSGEQLREHVLARMP